MLNKKPDASEPNEGVVIAKGGNTCGCDAGGVATPGIKGRVGADDYAISPEEWDKPPIAVCDVLYSVGGVYGNIEAIKTVRDMAAREQGEVCVVYNGDYHWLDGTADNFLEVERLLEGCIPLNGNVECELARAQDCGVGCGCSYPTTMSDAFVGRSNAIFGRMKESVAALPEVRALGERAAWGVVEVGGVRVGVTHGDERSVSGWGCSVDNLHDPERQKELDRFFAERDIDILSTTHTCAAAAIALPHGVVINNGSAGLPEYKGKLFGLVNRVSKSPHPDAVYRSRFKDVFIEAVPVRYDQEAFVSWFDSVWAEDSPAAQSYRPRAIAGPDTRYADAVLDGFEVLDADEE